MNIDEMKKSAINMVEVNDSIKAPLLKLNIKVNSGTTIPSSNELEIYVDKSSTATEERKTYTFPLNKVLEMNDEFVLEPVINEDKVLLSAYVKRREEKEIVKEEGIMLFEGVNCISTNYINADVSIVYPKNTDLVTYFLNNAIYGVNSKNKVLTMDDIYFKDCFTEVDGEINASFKALNIGCISSKYGNFKLDSSGNLQVKSIIVDDQEDNGGNLDFDSIYPVGSIYMNIMDINPNKLFGGTWEQVQDKFLLSAGTKYAAGSTGGSENHTHSFSHTHTVPGQGHSHGLGSAWAYISLYAKQVFIKKRSGVGTWWDTYQMTGSSYGTSGTGSSNSTATDLGGTTDWTEPAAVTTSSQSTATTSTGSSLPPYLTVYVWKRIA